MTGVYEAALGDGWRDLHPRVRKRYAVESADDVAGVGTGTMDVSRGVHVLPALALMPAANLLFPESGRDVPFTVVTVGGTDVAGREALATLREVRFPRTRRRFDSLTVWDDEGERLLDFLGTGGHLVAELRPRVEAGGLVVESGRQWLRAGGRYVRLPSPMAVDVTVRDRYDEVADRYHVDAVVESSLAGHVLGYRGTFTQSTVAREAVPATARPGEGARRLPG